MNCISFTISWKARFGLGVTVAHLKVLVTVVAWEAAVLVVTISSISILLGVVIAKRF